MQVDEKDSVMKKEMREKGKWKWIFGDFVSGCEGQHCKGIGHWSCSDEPGHGYP